MRVKRVIEPILVGAPLTADIYNDDFAFVKDLGLVDSSSGNLRIANPIYQEVIPRVLTHTMQMAFLQRIVEPCVGERTVGSSNARGTWEGFDTQASTPWEERGQLELVEQQGVSVTVLRA